MARLGRLRRQIGAFALAAFSAACTSTGAIPKPFPSPRASRPDPPARLPAHSLSSPDLYAVVGTALDLRGVRYQNGGADPGGFDCSGFTQYVFARHGIALPREVRDQYRAGEEVGDDLAPGDLLFFSTSEPGASHVAIAVGGDAFVHAPSSTGVVRVERLSSSYWSQRFVGARRIR